MPTDRMSSELQRSQEWESCTRPPAPSSPNAALSSRQSSTVAPDIGTIPFLPPNQRSPESSEEANGLFCPEKGSKRVDSAPEDPTKRPNLQGTAPASQPLLIASSWLTPGRPESPGVAANLLRRASRSSAIPPASVTPTRPGPHQPAADQPPHASLAALVHGHHAIPAPPETPPDKILDCSAARQLLSSHLEATVARGHPTWCPGDHAADTPPAAIPDLRSAMSGGFVRRRSGSGSRRVKPARARSNTKVFPHLLCHAPCRFMPDSCMSPQCSGPLVPAHITAARGVLLSKGTSPAGIPAVPHTVVAGKTRRTGSWHEMFL